MITSNNQVTYLTPPKSNFEAQYKSIRHKEGRWLSDAEVEQLPQVNPKSPHYAEWKKRSWILNKFETYLSLSAFNTVLDIGCGNGWMTHRTANYCDKITGLDVGKEELEQATRCFGSENIEFVCCDNWTLLPKNHFDLVYFAGSFHYFEPSLEFWSLLKSLLTSNGEIHIFETQFYSESERAEARSRSEEYFQSLGQDVDYYNHLSWKILPDNHEVLYKPNWRNKLFKNRSPFPWIRIRK